MKIFFHDISHILKENQPFLVTYIIIFLMLFTFTLFINKGDEIIYLNQFHNPINDLFFKFSSEFAEGLYYSILLIILGLFSIKYLFNGVITYLLSGAVTQILKRIFDIPRPKLFFPEIIINNLHFVEGVVIYTKFSFPSGHTTAAFSMMFFLSLITPNKYAKVLFAIYASLMGLARVYLVQHFFVDIIAGSIIGISITLLAYKLILTQPKIVLSNWYNYSVIEKLFKRKYLSENE